MNGRTSHLRSGVVSVGIVNFRGPQDTLTCVRSLLDRTTHNFPADRLEIICVDNASGDDSVEVLRSNLPAEVKLIESATNSGFTGGCNLAAEHATGEYLAFINNDARPGVNWLHAAVEALENDGSVSCVASKVLDWDGLNVDYVDGALTWFGMGYKPGAGAPYAGDHETPIDVLFPTGSAMVMRSQVFREVGGFDEQMFMFYEDVDLGWRLNILGHRVRYVPASVVFHKHHASMNKFGSYREWYLLERNALIALYKNLEDSTLAQVLAPAMALAVRRSLAIGGADVDLLDLRLSPGGDDEPNATVSKRSLTGPYAIDSFVDLLPSLQSVRSDLQRRRVQSDRDVAPLMRKAIEPAIPEVRYLAGHQALIDAFAITDLYPNRRQILVVTGDPLGARMAGPAIRALNIAEHLALEHDVRLVSTTACSLTHPTVHATSSTLHGLRAHVDWAEIVIFQGFLLAQTPWLAKTNKILIPDIYDPMHLEQLEQTRGEEVVNRSNNVAATVAVLNDQLLRGDFFLCASERQKHFWLGQLAALGRLNPKTYDFDATMSSLVGVVPFGLPSAPPVATRHAIKGAVPGIGEDDKVVLWAGGIYNWFDPLSLVRAIASLSERHDNVRLFFLGTQHPHPDVPRMRMLVDVRQLSDDLGLTDKFVFFNEGWVDYDDRHNYLLDADVGVSTHFEHIETTFAFRTRILDYIWAGLPLVVTEGDNFGDLVEHEAMGGVVAERDVAGIEAAIERALYDEEYAAACRDNVQRVRSDFEWPRALAPLSDFCRSARRASDALAPTAVDLPRTIEIRARARSELALVRQYMAAGGISEVTRRAAGRLRRLRGPA